MKTEVIGTSRILIHHPRPQLSCYFLLLQDHCSFLKQYASLQQHGWIYSFRPLCIICCQASWLSRKFVAFERDGKRPLSLWGNHGKLLCYNYAASWSNRLQLPLKNGLLNKCQKYQRKCQELNNRDEIKT